jgi:hypothetical protein
MSPISNFTEIRPVGAALIHADRRTERETDGHVEANGHFLLLCKSV